MSYNNSPLYNWKTQRAKTQTERFWEKINKEGPIPSHVPNLGNCWVWTASTRGKYGSMTIGKKGKDAKWRVGAHRYSWELHNGPIPDGCWVLHKCDNTACVRPEHLFLGNNSTNQKDACAKGRNNNIIKMQAWVKLHPEIHRGENCTFHKITESQAREIKALKGCGESQKKIAERYGLQQSIVSRIWSGKRWGWI